MAMAVELIGKRFNYLTVVSLDSSADYQASKGLRLLCDCGTEISRPRSVLTRKRRPLSSCGCKSAELNWKSRIANKSCETDKSTRAAKNYYSRYKGGAKARTLDFSLTFEQFQLLITGNCFYCNTVPARQITTPALFSVMENYSGIFNGIDRVNNEQGYTAENSVSCCTACNIAKAEMSIEEFSNLVTRIYKNLINKGTC